MSNNFGAGVGSVKKGKKKLNGPVFTDYYERVHFYQFSDFLLFNHLIFLLSVCRIHY